MKLLLDENLSHRLVPRLQTAYPGSSQVTLVGLGSADDLGSLPCSNHGRVPIATASNQAARV